METAVPNCKQTTKISEANFAECKDCGHIYWEGGSYWGLSQRIGLHHHKNDDGTWTPHNHRRNFRLFQRTY